MIGDRLSERSVWTAIKAVYSSLIAQSPAWEIAESFFNSLTRRVFATEGVDQAIEFVDTDFDAPPNQSLGEVRRVHSGAALPDLLVATVTDVDAGGFAKECWTDLRRTAVLAAERIEAALPKTDTNAVVSLEIIASIFYRGRGAYLVGRAIRLPGEPASVPLALIFGTTVHKA